MKSGVLQPSTESERHTESTSLPVSESYLCRKNCEKVFRLYDVGVSIGFFKDHSIRRIVGVREVFQPPVPAPTGSASRGLSGPERRDDVRDIEIPEVSVSFPLSRDSLKREKKK